MNKGIICVSVCARSARELAEKIKRAEGLADVIEVRLDCLINDPVKQSLSFLASNKTIVVTYRPKEQGGRIELDKNQRVGFWNAFAAHRSVDQEKFWIDCEFDLKSEISNLKFQKIISFHDFDSVPRNLEKILSDLSLPDSIVKIAALADDITDAIPIWKLLEIGNRQIIPIAMGEAGKWTRILGLAHGAAMTYASLESGRETAPGQISADDLTEVYRAGELDEETDVYGIIAGSTSYSMSPYIHNAAFKFHRLNSVFIPLEVRNLDGFVRRMVLEKTREINLNFNGFAVTNPHKQNIIKYLDELDESSKAIGAVNTIKIENGRLLGKNTDAEGFIEPLKNASGDLRGSRIAIFGSGGAARACIYAAKREGAAVTIFARDPQKAKALADEFEVKCNQIPEPKSLINTDIIINATPLGTKGDLENDSILRSEQLGRVKLVYDLVYNPIQTKLLRETAAAGASGISGSAMLIAQAAAQQEIWTGLIAPQKEMNAEVLKRLAEQIV